MPARLFLRDIHTGAGTDGSALAGAFNEGGVVIVEEYAGSFDV